MIRRMLTPGLVASLALAAAGPAGLAQQLPSPAAQRIRQDVTFLADDAREGRSPGTKGIEQAADYIAESFRNSGLKPAAGADGYFQKFEVVGSPALGEFQLIAAKGDQAIAAAPGKDASALAIGSSGNLDDIPVVFAGFGITAKDERKELDYDDYADLDVKGKAVLIIRRAPRMDAADGPFPPGATGQPNAFATFSHKATNAFARGAKAVLCVNDSGNAKDGKDELVPFEAAGFRRFSNLPFLVVTRAYADRLLKAGGLASVETLEKEISADLKPRSRALDGVTIDARVSVDPRKVATKNVVGVLEGTGPLADETIIIGAHYDHVGRNEFGGSLAGTNEIHNGADDNASGTATVMELARRIGARKDPLPRRIVFMTFSGEEEGLLGSQYYVKNPLYPLDKTVYMINFDMVGRLNENNVLHVYGAWSTPGMDDIVAALGKSAGFSTKLTGGTGGYFAASDHASFFQAGLPVLFFFTDVHPDYHRPSDDSDKINYPGMARIADLGELLLLDVARRPERPEFLKQAAPKRAIATAEPKPAADTAKASDPHSAPAAVGAEPGGAVSAAYLGSIPDYGDDNAEEGKGVRLSGVSPNSPAEKAGLKKGDVVVKFAGKPVGTLQDYTEYLRTAKPGDKVEIVVNRDGKETALQAVLGTRNTGAKQ